MTAAAPRFPDDPWLDTLLRQALDEDVGDGDVTTELVVDPDRRVRGLVRSRAEGVVCGLPLLPRLFGLLDPAVTVTPEMRDGDRVVPGSVLAVIAGPAAPVLTGERTALNLLQYLGGIATVTARYVAAVAGTGCRILDTRKTLPGYRRLAKYAVRCGGGDNHRLGLYDRYMLKDNHWLARRATLAELVAEARRRRPDLLVEVEVDSLDQLADVLPLRPDWILLDNFTPEAVAEAARRRDALPPGPGPRPLLEASGNVDLESVRSYAEAGVDAVSVGRLTHSVPALDIGLDLLAGEA